MIRFNCPHCGKTIATKDENAGTANKCPNPTCGKPVQIPTSLSSEQTTPVPPPPTPPSIVATEATQIIGSGGLLGWFTRAFGATTGMMVAFAIVFIVIPFFLCCGGCLVIIGISETSEHSDNRQTAAINIDTKQEADASFLQSASRKGEREKVAAKMLIELRWDDNWSWEELQDEVDFQFAEIKDEFKQWKQNCITAGDS